MVKQDVHHYISSCIIIQEHVSVEKNFKERWYKQIICPVEPISWKIDYEYHHYSDSSPISGSLVQ